MELVFYIFGILSVASTFCIIFSSSTMYALLYFLISILSISGIFFSIGAIFSGVIEVVIYIGAIMVLFTFTLMMLNLDKELENKEIKYLTVRYCSIFLILSIIFFIMILYGLSFLKYNHIYFLEELSIRKIGNKLLSSYALLVEFSSMMLLSSIVVSLYISNKKR